MKRGCSPPWLVTPPMLATLRPLLPRLNPYQLDPADVAAHGLPCDAYLWPQEPSNE